VPSEQSHVKIQMTRKKRIIVFDVPRRRVAWCEACALKHAKGKQQHVVYFVPLAYT